MNGDVFVKSKKMHYLCLRNLTSNIMHAFHADINKRLSIVSAPSSMMGDTLRKDSTMYVGAYEFCSNSSGKYYFANGYVDLRGSCPQSYNYMIKDHLGNVRHVDRAGLDNRGNEIVQVSNYYSYGGVHTDVDNGVDVQNHLYNGKELDRMHGLNLYDYSARQYDAAIGQFTSMDPLCEKYYHISPYAYCAGNPVKYTDPTGDTIRVDELYRAQFINSLVDVFGEQTSNSFGFDDRGNLTFNGSRNGLSKEQKKALKGLQKTMESKDVTNVVFGKSYDNNDANVHVSEKNMIENSGAITILASENPNTSENFIVVDPNASNTFPVDIVTADYYRLDGKTSMLSLVMSCLEEVVVRQVRQIGCSMSLDTFCMMEKSKVG